MGVCLFTCFSKTTSAPVDSEETSQESFPAKITHREMLLKDFFFLAHKSTNLADDFFIIVTTFEKAGNATFLFLNNWVTYLGYLLGFRNDKNRNISSRRIKYRFDSARGFLKL